MTSLSVPELNAETFVKHCLSHGLILTLYSYALQSLRDATSPDLKIALGEQIGQWLCRLKLDACEDQKEGKLILLLCLFSNLLSLELSLLTDSLPDHHSRLRSLLPGIAQRLVEWGEDRSNQGLWAALGFGPKSRLSPHIRFFCRAVAAFISSRLIDIGETNAEESRARYVASVEGMLTNREYEECWGSVDEVVRILRDDEGRFGLSELGVVVLRAGAFSRYSSRLYPL
jgi:hypothetical protein